MRRTCCDPTRWHGGYPIMPVVSIARGNLCWRNTAGRDNPVIIQKCPNLTRNLQRARILEGFGFARIYEIQWESGTVWKRRASEEMVSTGTERDWGPQKTSILSPRRDAMMETCVGAPLIQSPGPLGMSSPPPPLIFPHPYLLPVQAARIPGVVVESWPLVGGNLLLGIARLVVL